MVGRAGATRPVVKVGRMTRCEAVCVFLLAKRFFLSSWFSLWRLDDPVCVETVTGKPVLNNIHVDFWLTAEAFCTIWRRQIVEDIDLMLVVLAEGLSVCHVDHILQAHWHRGAEMNHGHPRNLTTTSKLLQTFYQHLDDVILQRLVAAKWMLGMC